MDEISIDVSPADSSLVISQITSHIESLRPQTPPATCRQIAIVLEALVRRIATSREDYVNRANTAVANVLVALHAFGENGLGPDQLPPGFYELLPSLVESHPAAATDAAAVGVRPTAEAQILDAGVRRSPGVVSASQTLQTPNASKPVARSTRRTSPRATADKPIAQSETQNKKQSKSSKTPGTTAPTLTPDIRQILAHTIAQTTGQVILPSVAQTMASTSDESAKQPSKGVSVKRTSRRASLTKKTRTRKRNKKNGGTANDNASSEVKVEQEIQKSPVATVRETTGNSDITDSSAQKARESLENEKQEGLMALALDVYLTTQMATDEACEPDVPVPQNSTQPVTNEQRNELPLQPHGDNTNYPNAETGTATNIPPVFQVPNGIAAGTTIDSTTRSSRSIPPQPSSSNRVPQTHEASKEYVRLHSDGMVEIQDGFVVSFNDLLLAASLSGIGLNLAQIPTITKEQALALLARSSQMPYISNGSFLQANAPSQMGLRNENQHVPSPEVNIFQSEPNVSPQATFSCSPIQQDIYQPDLSGLRSPAPLQVSADSNSTSNWMHNQPTQPRLSTGPVISPQMDFVNNTVQTVNRLRELQLRYKPYLPLLRMKEASLPSPTGRTEREYCRSSISLLMMDCTMVQDLNSDVFERVEQFLNNLVSQQSSAVRSNLLTNNTTEAENRGVPTNGILSPEIEPSLDLKNLNTTAGCAQGTYVPSREPNSVKADQNKEWTIPNLSSGASQHHLDTANNCIVQQIQNSQNAQTENDIGVCGDPCGDKSKGKGTKRKASPDSRINKSRKQTVQLNCNARNSKALRNAGITPEKAVRKSQAEGKSPVDLLDISDGPYKFSSMAGYSQKHKNGKVFNTIRSPGKSSFEDVLGRLQFMLNCSMKETSCYLTASTGNVEGATAYLKEIIIYVDPKTITSQQSNDGDNSVEKGLTFRELVKVECSEARKRYGAITATIREECSRPVFHCMIYSNYVHFPRFELRVAGYPRNSERTPRYERPPMGWIGILSEVNNLFRCCLENQNGVDAIMRRLVG